MSESEHEPDGQTTPDAGDAGGGGAQVGISDEMLPSDIRPGDDNPLANPLDPDQESPFTEDERESMRTYHPSARDLAESARDSGEGGDTGSDDEG